MLSRLAAWLQGFVTHNPGYKLVALMLALLLWFDVSTDETTVIQYPVPIRIAVEGRDMIVTNDVPTEIEVTFTGTGKELLRLDREQLAIQKEVTGGEADTTLVVLDPQDVQRPADLGVTPIAVLPGRIRVVTDRFVEKTVPLQTVGSPTVEEEGYRVGRVDVEPRRVEVRGVTAEVRPIGSLSLDLRQIERGPGPFDERLQIAVPESLRTVSVTPDSVRIRGEVVPIPPTAPPAQASADDGNGE